VYDDPRSAANATWWLTETLCYLRHLEVTERVRRVEGEPERWSTL
jgi:hypothetical protein